MKRPETTEYDPYYEKYVSRVTEPDLLELLERQPEELAALFRDATEDKGSFSYADGKWTIKEVLSHLIDGERMFAYRVLRISRGDETPIEGFEQDGYIANAHANQRPFAELLEEFALLRRANMIFFRNVRDDGWTRIGAASGVKVSVRALAYIMAGHVRHHVAILDERYLND